MSIEAVEFLLLPTKEQSNFLNKQLKYCTFVYNKILELAEADYKLYNRPWKFNKYVKLLPKLKEQYPELQNAISQALQRAVKQIDNDFQRFFEGKAPYPTKRDINILIIPSRFRIKGDKIIIPKLKTPIKFDKDKPIPIGVRSIAIIKEDNVFTLKILVKPGGIIEEFNVQLIKDPKFADKALLKLKRLFATTRVKFVPEKSTVPKGSGVIVAIYQDRITYIKPTDNVQDCIEDFCSRYDFYDKFVIFCGSSMFNRNNRLILATILTLLFCPDINKNIILTRNNKHWMFNYDLFRRFLR